MNLQVRGLFREIANIPAHERDRLLVERGVSPEVRADLQSLLMYDSAASESFTRRVSSAAQEALQGLAGPAYCGPYRLLRLLGSGGMGAVYLAERQDGELQQQVAVKLLRADADRPAWRERFLRERQLLANLNHPSITRLIDAGHTDDGRPYLVMEKVDGVSIDEYAARLDVRSRLRLFLEVCEGVSHAHGRLIVHRDLKPSNILVDSSGHPKLLDFGIAKLLDVTADETRTVDRLLTPNYASPEQFRGGIQTTATDVYSLGAVLHKLLTGRSPRESAHAASDEAPAEATPREEPKLPRDLKFILAKALREEPGERYASVEAFAEDIHAFLESRPVKARSGNAWYRTRKFLRRYWIPVLAASLAVAGPTAGMWVAHRQRVIAERRFAEVRQLSNKLFEIDRQVVGLPGSTKARQLIVDTSLDYLRRLAADVQDDPDLALDVGTAYMRVGRVQGVPISANLGQTENAEENLRVAEKLVRSVLAAEPGNRTAFLRAAQIAHDRMVLAEDRHPDIAALPLAFESEHWLDKYLAGGLPEEGERDQAVLIGINVSNWYVRKELSGRALALLRRMIDLSRRTGLPRQIGAAQIIVARTLRREGDLEGALAAARDAARMAVPPPGDTRASWKWSLSLALSTQAAILGEDDAVSLGRGREAAELFARGLRIEEDLASRDPNDSRSRLSLAIRGIGLAGILRHSEPARALEIYDEVLARMAEVRNNAKARREEVLALAGSTYPLRRMGRWAEARKRLDRAFERLRDLQLYPAEAIDPDSEAVEALSALAEFEAGSGNTGRALEQYRFLLDRMRAFPARPESSVADATRFSSVYAALSAHHRRAGQTALAREWEERRLELWRKWDRKLPNNSFVRLQIGSQRQAF